MLKKMRNNKKGFTLVELIVVLVILAILAALLIPALTGYIDKAKEKDLIAETRQTVMAAQTLVDEAYAKEAAGTTITVGATGATVAIADVAKLAEVKPECIISVTVSTEGKIDTLVYQNKGKRCTYDPTAAKTYTVGKAE